MPPRSAPPPPLHERAKLGVGALGRNEFRNVALIKYFLLFQGNFFLNDIKILPWLTFRFVITILNQVEAGVLTKLCDGHIQFKFILTPL